MTRRELAARRRLLAANATLQRVRLAHDAEGLRHALRPALWAGVALASGALAVAGWARGHTHRAPSTPTAASVWALRGLTLWRAVRALRRLAK